MTQSEFLELDAALMVRRKEAVRRHEVQAKTARAYHQDKLDKEYNRYRQELVLLEAGRRAELDALDAERTRLHVARAKSREAKMARKEE